MDSGWTPSPRPEPHPPQTAAPHVPKEPVIHLRSLNLKGFKSFPDRTRLDFSAAQERNPLWTRLSDGDLRNAYTVHVRNMEERPRQVELSLEGLPGAAMASR